MSRSSVNLALLGLGEHEQRVLVSAVSALAGPALLPADVRWSSASDADIVIVAVDRPEALHALAELDSRRPREQVRYASQPRSDADVVRPLRIQHLLGALQRAVEHTLQRQQQPAAEPSELPGKRQFYRGAEVAAAEGGDEAARAVVAEHAAPGKRIYRGRAY